MKIVKLLEGNILKLDNTKVNTPIITKIKKVPSNQYLLIDLKGKPSLDNRTSNQRNEDYWNPIKGAYERFKSTLKNNTNPIKGFENTILPSLGGAALVTTPATVIGGLLGGEYINSLTGGFGKWLEDKVGIPQELGEYLNPGALYGGTKGYNISKNQLASKFIKGDADLGWSALDKNHWIFNKETRNPTNIAMASLNRIMPFLSNIEKTPARIAAYNIGKRTKGNASVSLKDIKNNDSTYTGAATPEGNNGDRNLLGLYLFSDDPVINKTPWFNSIKSSFKKSNIKGFPFNERYSKLYPGIENRRYLMNSVIKGGRPLTFKDINEFREYSGELGKVTGKEGDMVIDIGGEYLTFRQPGTNYIGPIDDVGGHVIKIDYNKGKLSQMSQDLWKFNPSDYLKRWSGKNKSEGVRATKLAALMDKVGTPFILQQSNPILIGRRRIWESLDKVPEIIKNRRLPKYLLELLLMKKGGSFKFKESLLVKNAKRFNGRDMRRKFIRSDRPTYSRTIKGLEGLKFVEYTPLYIKEDIPSLSIFSPYTMPDNYIIRLDIELPKEEQTILQEESKNIPVLQNTNILLKPNNKVVMESKGLDEFNKWYDEVEKTNPEAAYYRAFLTKMAELESGFNSYIQNKAGAPAYGYFQFMQDGKKYNNITAYAGTDVETFRNNPKLLIQAAIKLAKLFEKGFSEEDLKLAALKGYTKFGLLGGAWLAGNGGVRKYLKGEGNPSDKHWSKSGAGTTVEDRINLFNF